MLAVASTPVALSQRKAMRGKAISVAAAPRRAAPKAIAARADGFIGSPTNIVMFATITSFMAAGRFGVMPTANAGAVTSARTVLNFDPMVLGHSDSYFKLNKKNSGLLSGDPSGFTWVDTVASAALGHIVGAGIVLGLGL